MEIYLTVLIILGALWMAYILVSATSENDPIYRVGERVRIGDQTGTVVDVSVFDDEVKVKIDNSDDPGMFYPVEGIEPLEDEEV